MNKLIFILLYLFFSSILNAQPYETNPDFKRANHWIFGDSVWIDFNYNPPLNRNGSNMSAIEPSTSFSDINGNLLLYSDGITIWNGNHNIIQNGSGLKGHFSSRQGAVFVNDPENDSIVFLFTTDAHCGNNGLRYTKIKLFQELDSAVVVDKNVLLIENVTESINVVKHGNKIDNWVVVHSGTGNFFYSFLVTSNNVVECPVETSLGYNFDGHSLNCQTLGDFNLSGNKFSIKVFRDDKILLFDFNSNTGVFSNFYQFDDIYIPTGITFSSNDSFLYIVERDDRIKRLNINTNIFDTIALINAFDYFIIQTALTPNGIIFCNILDSSNLGIIKDINDYNPEFILNGFSVDKKKLTAGLPNFNKSYFHTPMIDFSYELNCIENTIQFNGRDTFQADNHQWLITKQGVTPITANIKSPLIQFGDSGTYRARYIASNGARNDTIIKEVIILPKIEKNFLGNDTGWCESKDKSIEIKAPVGMQCYEWSTGSNNSEITIDTSGVYWVKIVTPNFCVIYDTINITLDTIPDNPIIYQVKDSLKTDVDAKVYNWYKGNQLIGENQPYLKLIDTGIYQLKTTSNGGCISESDTFHVYRVGTENISFENIKVFPNPFTNHLYINGINNSIAKIVIHSIEGKILKELVPKDSETIVKTNDLAEGIYIVRLQLTNNEIINYKTIKIKR